MGGEACKAKVILNSTTIAYEVNQLAYQIEENDLSDEAGIQIVKYLNVAEDAIFRAKRTWLESQGFDGPWPNSLK